MAEQQQTIPLTSEHRPAIARLTHVCEWTRDELARLQAELAVVAGQHQRAQAHLAALIARAHGVDILHEPGWTVDAEAGTLTGPAPAQPAEPTDETAQQPQEE